jgi:hypothetical protein
MAEVSTPMVFSRHPRFDLQQRRFLTTLTTDPTHRFETLMQIVQICSVEKGELPFIKFRPDQQMFVNEPSIEMINDLLSYAKYRAWRFPDTMAHSKVFHTC